MNDASLWVLSGGSSVIAQAFAHIAARHHKNLLLIGRNSEELSIICSDIRCRYPVQCDYIRHDFNLNLNPLLTRLNKINENFSLFLGHAQTLNNKDMSMPSLQRLVQTNVQANLQLIYHYWQRPQSAKNIIYLSSVAAALGRSKNSAYGASKACIEVHLQGLQQQCNANQHILIARAGYIDTQQTFGVPGIFYAAPPASFAKQLWKSNLKQHHLIYYPKFWRFIMITLSWLPWKIYKKLNF